MPMAKASGEFCAKGPDTSCIEPIKINAMLLAAIMVLLQPFRKNAE
jgi:hypothetical protein